MNRIQESTNLNPLVKEAYLLSKKLHENGTYSWFSYINEILSECNLHNIIIDPNQPYSKRQIKNIIKLNVKKEYEDKFFNKLDSLDESNKLFIYKTLKKEYMPEKYLSINNSNLRNMFTLFRLCEHKLELNMGRIKKIPRNQRLCKMCGVVENEVHFFFQCPFNESA